jgi:hypothetical protein
VCSPRPVASKVAVDTPLLLTGHVFGDSYPRPCVCRDLLVIVACSKNKKENPFFALLC